MSHRHSSASAPSPTQSSYQQQQQHQHHQQQQPVPSASPYPSGPSQSQQQWQQHPHPSHQHQHQQPLPQVAKPQSHQSTPSAEPISFTKAKPLVPTTVESRHSVPSPRIPPPDQGLGPRHNTLSEVRAALRGIALDHLCSSFCCASVVAYTL